jgi:hypothetical protein
VDAAARRSGSGRVLQLSVPGLMHIKAGAWTRSRVAESFETAFSRPILASEECDGEFC